MMAVLELHQELQSALKILWPEAQILRATPMLGGISAEIFRLHLQDKNGIRWSAVARFPGSWVLDRPGGINAEADALEFVQEHGLGSPKLLYLGQDFYIMEYIDGTPNLDVDYADDFVNFAAHALAELDRITWSSSQDHRLRHAKQHVPPMRANLDEELQERRIRSAISRLNIERNTKEDVLVHGDFWPGNVLWALGKPNGLVDWETACWGAPLYDLAIARLDTFWVYGHEAMLALTERYFLLTKRSESDLKFYDLIASLRPCGMIHEYARAYPDLGRPDIDANLLIDRHQQFVDFVIAK